MKSLKIQFIFVLSVVLFIVACNPDTGMDNARGGSTSNAVANEIICHTAYRSSVTVAIEEEDEIVIPNSNTIERREYDELVFNVQYWSGQDVIDGGRGLRLWITRPDNEMVELQSQLYQLPLQSSPANQFEGGHGFSGLNYAYFPDSDGAELQFWCEAS